MPRKSRSDESPSFGFALWPINKGPRRKLFVVGVTEDDRALLVARNYEPVDVLGMPRATEEQHQEAIEAWLQGMAEGSIPLDEERRKTLMDEAKVRGLLVTKSIRTVKHTADESIEAMLNFSGSRHMKNGASPERIAAAVKAATTPGKEEKH